MKKQMTKSKGITLIALVITIIILLILAGVTISLTVGQNGILKHATNATIQTEISQLREQLELCKAPVLINNQGFFDKDEYFEEVERQGIINNKETDVIDNGDGTYDVTTKPGYVFLVTLMPTVEKPTDAKIEYIGQAGKIAPIIKRLDVSATSTSITGKAVVARLGNGTIKYYYKSTSAADSTYQEITNVTSETGATQSTGIIAGENYTIKVVAKNDIGEVVLTKEVIATKVFVESVTLNKTTETLEVGDTVTLVAIVKPDDATNKNIVWESSDTAIATVSDDGIVTGKSKGTVSITAKATDGSNKTATCTITVKKSTIADLVGEPANDNKNIETEDSNGNKIVIPAGFKVVPNGGTDEASKVDYTYNGDGTPAVQDGVVIEDSEGNQFVWIPIGDIKNKNGTTTTITFGRYYYSTFMSLSQNADDYDKEIGILDGSQYYKELIHNRLLTNVEAKNLAEFVEKTKLYGGYYLARYEASKGSDGKPKSQANKTPWTDISQRSAASQAGSMYSSSYFESDLVNSYMWDTAIMFIQEYSGNSKYSSTGIASSKVMDTGKVEDKVCNIHNMASNCMEWTTETSEDNGSGATVRGGVYYTSSRTSVWRQSFSSSSTYSEVTFRSGIYVK